MSHVGNWQIMLKANATANGRGEKLFKAFQRQKVCQQEDENATQFGENACKSFEVTSEQTWRPEIELLVNTFAEIAE